MNDLFVPKHTVIQYVRNKNWVPYGVIVAIKGLEGQGFTCGYSLCNKKDRFNKKMALKIAIGRAIITDVIGTNDYPHDVRKMMPAFFDRCKKYYKV